MPTRVRLIVELKPSQVDQLKACGKILNREGYLTAEAMAGFLIDRWLPELYKNLTDADGRMAH